MNDRPSPLEVAIVAANTTALAPVVAALTPSLPVGTKFIDVPFENALGALCMQLDKITESGLPHGILNAREMAGDLLNRYMREKQERQQLEIGEALMRPRHPVSGRPLTDAAEKEPEGTPLEASIDPERWAMAAKNLTLDAGADCFADLAPLFAGAMAASLQVVRKQLEILDFWAERMKVTDLESGRPLHKNPDARVWAREFLGTIGQIEKREGKKICDPMFFDEGWLVSWFANAMMACYDFALEQTAKELAGTAIVPMDYAVKAGLYHCTVHDREAKGFTNEGKPCCAPDLLGNGLPCECVLKDPESPVES